MINVGQENHMRVTRTVDFGVYLDGEDLGEILLPKRYVPEHCTSDDTLMVFVYLDSEDRFVATTTRPKAMVNQCAALKVAQINPVGAFLDWGLPKDLLVPFSEQAIPMRVDNTYVVYLYIDQASGRIVASSKLDKFIPETNAYFKARQAVDIQIYAKSDLGYKAVIGGTTLGQLFKNEVFRPLRVGQKLSAFIKTIREDKKIDLALQLAGSQAHDRDKLTQLIIEHLKANGGSITLTDKSPPDAIYATFHVSKGSYKKALGALYKQRKITLSKEAVILI